MERRNFFRSLVGAAGIVAAGSALPLQAEDQEEDDEHLADVAKIYRLQAAFHLAKSTQDINLLMSLWDVNGSLTIPGDPNSPYVGLDRLTKFTLNTGSFTHHRLSLVPSFKIKIDVHGDEAFFYEECHDVENFGASNSSSPPRFIASDSFLAGTLRKIGGKWLFSDMHGGSASPLSVDHYYFP